MYTDEKAPKEIRGQAQALLVFLTQGVGMFFGYKIMAGGSLFGIPLNLTFGKYGQQVASSEDYSEALKTAIGEKEPLSFTETFGNMVSRDLPDALPADQLETTMGQWQNFWMSPAIMAGIVMVLFAVLFWDGSKSKVEDKVEDKGKDKKG